MGIEVDLPGLTVSKYAFIDSSIESVIFSQSMIFLCCKSTAVSSA